MTRKVVDEKNNIDIRHIVLTNKGLVAKNDAPISFQGIGAEQLLAIIGIMGGDFHWKLEWRPTKRAADVLYWCQKCNLWQKFDSDNRCSYCKTSRH